MRPAPDDRVFAWVASRPRQELYVAAVTQAEIFHGIALQPSGKRKTNLAATAEAVFAEDFAGRILVFDSKAARHYAAIRVARCEASNPIEVFDALIAATTLAAGALVATRDTGGFRGCGMEVVDTWSSGL